jgi:hypothetical protein
MRPPPLLHTAHFVRAAEVIAVLGLAPPLALGGNSAGTPTGGTGAIALVVAVAVVRIEHPSTATAFTAVGLGAHDAPEPEENGWGLDPNHPSEQKNKPKKEQGFWRNPRKKTPPKKMHFSTARLLN